MQQAAVLSFPGEETLPVTSLPVFTGGCIETFAWIAHGGFASAWTANLVFSRSACRDHVAVL